MCAVSSQKIEKEETNLNSFYEASITMILKPKINIVWRKKQNYRPISFMNTDTRFLKEILATKVCNTGKLVYYDQIFFNI